MENIRHMSRERMSWIDSAKGIAVIMIYTVHCVGILFPSLSKWTYYGQYGVEIFLLCNGLFGMNYFQKSGSTKRTRFILKRVIRIIPVFWLMIVITYLLNYVELGQTFNKFSHLLKNNSYVTVGAVLTSMLLVSYVYPKWAYLSLFTETYIVSNLLFVLLLTYIKKRKGNFKNNYLIFEGAIIVFAISALISLGIPVFENRIESKENFYFIQYNARGVSAYFAGVILFMIYSKMKEREIVARINKIKCNWLYLGLIIFSVANCYYSNNWNSVYFIASLIILLIMQYICGWRIFDNVFFQYIGKYSWAFYFIHPIVFYAMFDYFDKMVLLIGAFFVSISLSIVVTEIYEKPIIKTMELFLNSVGSLDKKG